MPIVSNRNIVKAVSTRGGGGVPQSLIDKMVLWTSKEDEKDDYYVNKIGDQEREALTDGAISGVVHPGRAIQYDGAKEQYSRTVGNMPDNFKLANNPITIFFRIKMDANPTVSSYIFGRVTIASGYYYGFIRDDGSFSMTIRAGDGSYTRSTSSSIADGNWHDIFVLINTAGNFALYLDNVLQGTVMDISGKTFADITNDFQLGDRGFTEATGIKQIRDFRLWSSAITSESDRDAIHGGDYVAGCTSWWFMEEGKESNTYRIKDAIGTNDLNNFAFDATSLVSGAWNSLFNKFGYSPVVYESDDVIEGDGTFSDSSLWTYTPTRFDISGGTANFKAVDTSAPNMVCKRVISYSVDDVLKVTFEITAASDSPRLRLRTQSGAAILAEDDYSIGTHEVIFRPLVAGTGIGIVGVFSGGSFSIDNFVVTKYEAAIISPKMNAAVPTVDLFDRALTFFGQAKYNLEKVSETLVNLPDYVGELFDAAELITINDWFDAAGVGNEILLTNIEAYQTKRQYYNDEQLIIIKADETLTDAEDTLLKTKLMLVSETYTPIYTIRKGIGEIEGTTSEIYAMAQAVLDGENAYTEIEQEYSEPIYDPSDKYVSFLCSDFFESTDPKYTLPMAVKYGFSNTFQVQIVPRSDDYRNTIKFLPEELELIERSWSWRSDHSLFQHISFLSTLPTYDGRTIPSANDLRIARLDGTNELGHDVTDTIDNALGEIIRLSWMRLSNEFGAKAWQDLTDADCLAFTKAIGAFGMPIDAQNGQKVLEAMDYLSNRYCGTTGLSVYDDYDTRTPNTSDGNEPSSENKIQGGIFQGASTTQNHEIWERLLIIIKEYKKEFEGKFKDDLWWSSAGGTGHGLFYNIENPPNQWGRYADKEHTILATGAAEHTSSITGITRSLLDALRSSGYKGTMAAVADAYGNYSYTAISRLEAQAMFKKNGIKKTDWLGDGYANMLHHYNPDLTAAEQISLLTEADVTKAIYDLCALEVGQTPFLEGRNFNLIVDEISKQIAWGMIPDLGDDTGSSGDAIGSYVLSHEAFYQYLKRAGIKMIAKEDAVLISETEYTPANFFPNADFETTPKTVLASTNAPDYPDGWGGGEVLSEDTGAGAVNVLHIDTADTFFTRQYAIKPGSFSFSFKGIGAATLKIRKILNKDTYNSTDGSAFTEINSIAINSETYTEYTDTVVIEDAAMEVYETPTTPEEKAYQNYMKGYGNKVCGIQIELIVTGVNYVKIGNCELSIQ